MAPPPVLLPPPSGPGLPAPARRATMPRRANGGKGTHMTTHRRSVSNLALLLVAAVSIGFAAGTASGSGDPNAGAPRGERISMPGFGRVVYLSHVNNPSRTP